MKKITFLCLPFLFILSCNNHKEIPDVSNIKADFEWIRFDREFFSIDSNNIPQGLAKLEQQHPLLTGIFLQNILGLDSTSVLPGVKRFLGLSGRLYDTINHVFSNTIKIEQDFKTAFQFIRYYFPDYKIPSIATVAGPVDALAISESGPTPDFLRPELLGISLQFYLGKNFSIYKDPFFIESVAPAYRSRRFSREYIVADAIKLVIENLFPYQAGKMSLIEQMVEKGKQWYLLDKFMPTTPDSIKTGYTQQQLDWCIENEGLIWSYIVRNEDLNSLNPVVIQTYIGEGPFTQGFSQEFSPGNLGQWLGWQIVKKYLTKNETLSPEELMHTKAGIIINEAKYKPK